MKTQEEIIKSHIQESIAVKSQMAGNPEYIELIAKAGKLVSEAFQQNKRVFLCGNGGSAADAQHIAAELLVRYKSSNNRKALPAISLSTDPSFITAAANDLGYEFIFARSLEGLSNEGDVLIGISTSGFSNNIIQAVKTAKDKNLKIILLLGGDGGKLSGSGDIEIIVPSKETARIQESHILIGHIICSLVEKTLFNLD